MHICPRHCSVHCSFMRGAERLLLGHRLGKNGTKEGCRELSENSSGGAAGPELAPQFLTSEDTPFFIWQRRDFLPKHVQCSLAYLPPAPPPTHSKCSFGIRVETKGGQTILKSGWSLWWSWTKRTRELDMLLKRTWLVILDIVKWQILVESAFGSVQ